MNKVLVVDDKQMMRDSVTATLSRAGFGAIAAPDGATAIQMVMRHRPAAVITDLKMPEMDGIQLLSRIGEIDSRIPVVLMTAYATIDTAVSAMKQGAFDYIQKPFEGDQLVLTVRRAVEHYQLRRENEALKQSRVSDSRKYRLVGDSPIMDDLRRQIEQVSASHSTVLVTGESGTGKEIVAHMIHALSPRREQVMMCVNCAALSENLLESELFGHEKGAFTGADRTRRGRFELADGGTLLLDEVSEISSPTQAKLLRVLQERQFERVGSSTTMETDVRVIATTNRQIERAVGDGVFRQDLYFRLNVLPLHVPPLRDRRDDIPQLAEYFLVRQAMRDGRPAKHFDEQAIAQLCDYAWPGNVRELENICERAGVLAREERIPAGLIRPWLDAPGVTGSPGAAKTLEVVTADSRTLEDVEREVIVSTLSRYRGHRQRTAKALGIGVRTLGLKLRKWKDLQLVAQTL